MTRTRSEAWRGTGTAGAVRIVRTAQRKRTIAVQFAPDGSVVVRAPLRTPRAKVEEVLRSKTVWLEKRRAGLRQGFSSGATKREFVAGETFHFLGRQFRLKTGPAMHVGVAEIGEYLWVSTPSRARMSWRWMRSRLREWYKRQADAFLPGRVQRWGKRLGINSIGRIAVSDQSRRWASCADDGTIRFNWRVMCLPVSLIDYVIVHELCHLHHPSHAQPFWRELTRALPDRKERERMLAQLGPVLVLD